MAPSTKRVHLKQIAVGKQCSVPWETMHGDGATRMCGSCKTPVHNLSEMTEEQADALLARDGDMCVVYYYRADGTIVSSPSCPTTQRPRSSRLGAAAMTGALAYTTAFAGIAAVTAGTDDVAERADGTKVACGIILRIKPRTPQQERELAHQRLQRMDRAAPTSDAKPARAEEAEPAIDLGLDGATTTAPRPLWPVALLLVLGLIATLSLTAWLALGIAPLALLTSLRYSSASRRR